MTALERFVRSVDALFGSLGMTATYIPVHGANAVVAVVPKRPDQIIGIEQSEVMAEVTLFDLRVSEVALPKADDVILYNGEQYRLIGEPRRDIHRLIWTVEAVLYAA